MSYKKGLKFEYEIKQLFESAGYYVMRSAGSHGIFDLIAIKNGKAFGIQCKYNNHLRPAERIAMLNAGKRYGIVPIYAHRDKRKPLILENLATNELIDPATLDSYVDMLTNEKHD